VTAWLCVSLAACGDDRAGDVVADVPSGEDAGDVPVDAADVPPDSFAEDGADATPDGEDVAPPPDCPAGTAITAASPQLADVRAAIDRAAPGDTVIVPSGSAVWLETLVLDKPIVLRGVSQADTVIRNGGVDTLVSIELPADEFVRVADFTFDAQGYETSSANMRSAIWVGGALTQVRIDHCTFDGGKTAIRWADGARGVTDHCTFHNVDLGVRLSGDNDDSWNRPIRAGTLDAVFIEDNRFLVDPEMPYEPNEQIYHDSWGARTTVRFNRFEGTFAGAVVPLEAHGDWPNPPAHARSVVLLEIYGNTFVINNTYRMLFFRGGSLLVHDNTFTHAGGDTAVIAMTEEASWQTAFFDPLDTEWPAQDQINNSFFWNNTLNGAPVTGVVLWHDEDLPFIQEGRDYWMHEPRAAGGRTVYTGAAGFDMEFVADSPNAHHPYTPYDYPHPLLACDPPVPPDV
jgi:hypothetical protein